jgi:hypothetical protein
MYRLSYLAAQRPDQSCQFIDSLENCPHVKEKKNYYTSLCLGAAHDTCSPTGGRLLHRLPAVQAGARRIRDHVL